MTSPPCVRSMPYGCAILLLSLLCYPTVVAAGDGKEIYQQQCAVCHGEKGEGVKGEYAQPLVGDKSVGELARLIEKTMPKGSPEDCVGEDARRVAAYIHETFYSPTAQARHKPARIELSRLTVRQYRNVMADLVAGLRTQTAWPEERGLNGEYFKNRRFRSGERMLERVDAEVKFDFGEDSPQPGKLDAAEFAIRWQGGLYAPETGEYELILKTTNGARLWINDMSRTLVDVWVRSGNDTEHRQSVWLLGGRVYPLKLEMFKAKEKTAAMELRWKLPQQAADTVPARCLLPGRFAEQMALETPFPPDDRSIGYERGTSVSKAWESATTDGAIEAAGYIVARLEELSGAKGSEEERRSKLQEFCRKLAERAFRRPLSNAERQLYIERQFEGAPDLNAAVKRCLLLTFKSPRFLYREIGNENDAYDVASRLSFALWDSLPDETLLEAAAAGRLSTPQQIQEQARRMLDDPRTRAKLRDFLLAWLKVDSVPDLSKDSEHFAEFDEHLAADLRTSLELFLSDVLWSETADFRQLMLADYVYLNGRLAAFYGADLPADAPFQKVTLDAGQRAGLISHPYLLASFAYTSTSSPIHRGVFVARSLLGRMLRPPPEAVSPLAPDLHPNLSTRERVVLQTSPQMCQSCHTLINPLGFALEHFDAVGRFRGEEKGKLINARGTYLRRDGQEQEFQGARELATMLAGSDEAHTAFIEQLFHHLIKQPVRAYGAEELARLRKSLIEHDFNMRQLVIEIVASAALRGRDNSETAATR